MKITLVNNYTDFAKLNKQWNKLLVGNESNHIHITFNWVDTWWKYYCKDKKIFVLLASFEDELIGIAPLCIRKIGKFIHNTLKVKQLTFLADGFSDKADFIITKRRNEVIHAFCNFILSNQGDWDEISLKQMDTDSPNYEPLIDYLKSFNKFNVNISKLIGCPYLTIPSNFDSYYASLNKKWTKEIERKIRKIKKEKTISFEVITDISKDLLNEIYQLNWERNKATNRRSIFLDEIKYKFIKDIVKQMKDNKWIKLFLMRDEEKLIAYSFSYDYNKTINRWNTSFDLGYNKYSTGNYLMKFVLKYCCENNYHECSFMAGEEDYKFNWTTSLRNNQLIFLTKKNIKSKILNVYPTLRLKLKSGESS